MNETENGDGRKWRDGTNLVLCAVFVPIVWLAAYFLGLQKYFDHPGWVFASLLVGLASGAALILGIDIFMGIRKPKRD